MRIFIIEFSSFDCIKIKSDISLRERGKLRKSFLNLSFNYLIFVGPNALAKNFKNSACTHDVQAE